MKKKTVYMLEDDSDDRYITQSIIDEIGLPVQIKYFTRSDHFLDFLATAPKAFLILVDYNSKPDNAESILQKIKMDQNHAGTPIVILSDSSVTKYKERCYALGASSFIEKPSTVNRTKRVIQIFFTYWLTIEGVIVEEATP